jgi:DNA-binding GntR family transcriptional regulator
MNNGTALLSPISKSTRTEDVFQLLRHAILNNELKTGDRLLETEIAEKLSVSRTPVREAIRMLEAKGLVTRLNNSHGIVADRSLRVVIDIFHVRIALESYAAHLAADNISDEQIVTLQQMCNESKRMYRRHDSEGLKRLGNDFHNTILAIAGNPQIIKHLREIYEWIDIYRDRLYAFPIGVQANTISHCEIIDALRDRDGNLAQELMRKHLLISLDNLKALWEMVE